MRSLQLLVQEFPNKTGKELLEIQEQDKREEEARIQKRFGELLEQINDWKENGCYYRGEFGLSQKYYYNFSNFQFWKDSGKVTADVKKIVFFFEDDFSAKIYEDRYVELDKYGLTTCERVTEDQFNEVESYVRGIKDKFW